mmetsp:Transcript_11477/g.49449  ORF Transcript_11477/g.49449 Transcript_11477/m.49449 type:complete len:352 (+) Transcript_11477:500-1555(+)
MGTTTHVMSSRYTPPRLRRHPSAAFLATASAARFHTSPSPPPKPRFTAVPPRASSFTHSPTMRTASSDDTWSHTPSDASTTNASRGVTRSVLISGVATTPAAESCESPKARETAKPPARGNRRHTRAGPAWPCKPRAGSTTPPARETRAASSGRSGLWSTLRSTATYVGATVRVPKRALRSNPRPCPFDPPGAPWWLANGASRPPPPGIEPSTTRPITHRESPTLATTRLSPRLAQTTHVDPLSAQSAPCARSSAFCAVANASSRTATIDAAEIRLTWQASAPRGSLTKFLFAENPALLECALISDASFDRTNELTLAPATPCPSKTPATKSCAPSAADASYPDASYPESR